MTAAVVVLAAGLGTRMKSERPKSLHEICGRSLLGHVLAAAGGLSAERTVVVVGHGADELIAHLAAVAPEAQVVGQDRPGGTGHAARTALDALGAITVPLVVVPGDAPLLRAETLVGLLQAHRAATADATLLTARPPDPSGYGRVMRGPDGSVLRVVEEQDADAETRAIREVATSVYVFEPAALRSALQRIGSDNAKGEEYLTDAVELIARDGGRVLALPAGDWREAVGVNDRSELAAAARFMRDRINRDWMLAGVTIMDPASTWVDVDVRLGPDVTLLPQTYLRGRTAVRSGATVGPDCTLEDTEVDAGATVTRSVCVGARIGAGATVGPYSYLRAKTVLGPRTKAGAFVEMKNARLAAEAKVPHLSYVGDASIGERTNIGAATVFVNYDGLDKHHTEVGDDVRIGSDSMLVAPVVVGDGAYTAAGSVITSDVPPGALAVSRGRQRNIEDWVHRRRPGTAAARAAERARERQPRSGQDENGDAETKPGRGAAER